MTERHLMPDEIYVINQVFDEPFPLDYDLWTSEDHERLEKALEAMGRVLNAFGITVRESVANLALFYKKWAEKHYPLDNHKE